MKISSYQLRTLSEPLQAQLSTLGYDEFTSNPDWKHNLISFTSLVTDPTRHRLICGLTSFDCDLMYEFDPDSETFRSFDYPSVADKFEIKIHRSLYRCSNGDILGATACLHRENRRKEGPGGRIFILNPEIGKFDFLPIPVPHDYIQTITVDEKRFLLYGFTYPVFNFFVLDLRTRKVRRVDYMGSIPHIVSLAPDGKYWATWNCRSHNLFCYDPDLDEITFYKHPLPCTAQSCNLMYPGAGPIDSMTLGKDGMLYIGEAFGNLDRLDPQTGEVENLGKPLPDETRIAALKTLSDGRLIGVAGFRGRCHLFIFDGHRFQTLGHIQDDADGTALYIGHDLAIMDGNSIFIGETDTSDRAGRLWKCQIP